MTSRKKNLLLVQITIFLFACALLYNTYRDKKPEKENFVKIEAQEINKQIEIINKQGSPYSNQLN